MERREVLHPLLRPGEYVEVQWKARIDHPFGWWLGQVREVSHDHVMVEFVQYPETSLWRCLEIPFLHSQAIGRHQQRLHPGVCLSSEQQK